MHKIIALENRNGYYYHDFTNLMILSNENYQKGYGYVTVVCDIGETSENSTI